jgi:hypothetical protein
VVGRVIVGGNSYPNSWLEDGRTIRLVMCQRCLDTGRQLTDDGALGERCGCAVGESLPHVPRPLCRAICVGHQRMCSEYADSHSHDSQGNELHVCSYGPWNGHQFWAATA